MPELPEVETIKMTLRRRLIGRRIEAVEVLSPRIIAPESRPVFAQTLQGRTVQGLRRRGKYLVFCFGAGFELVVHLKMTGQLYYARPEQPRKPKTRLVFGLDDGGELRYADARGFGIFYLVPAGDYSRIKGLATLGPEPLSPEFTPEHVGGAVRRRAVRIKQLLLDQRLFAGVGNIYADESLFAARINPLRRGNSLSDGEIAELHRAIEQEISEGIEHHGTTTESYVDGDDRVGEHQHHLEVYGRAGEPCRRCGERVRRVVLGGRGTYFCPGCQRQGANVCSTEEGKRGILEGKPSEREGGGLVSFALDFDDEQEVRRAAELLLKEVGISGEVGIRRVGEGGWRLEVNAEREVAGAVLERLASRKVKR